MSIEIDWTKLTTGDDGLALAASIKDFIHEKFQQVTLPGFIRAVEVHSFEFGEQCPSVVIKDICDPLPDFYEDDTDDDDQEEGEERDTPQERKDEAPRTQGGAAHASSIGMPPPQESSLSSRRSAARKLSFSNVTAIATAGVEKPRQARPLPTALPTVDTRLPHLHTASTPFSQLASPLMSRSSTPGIPGGTSNMSYFHLPLSARLQGSQIGLAAMTGSSGLQQQQHQHQHHQDPNSNHHHHHAHPWEQHPRQISPQRRALDGDYYSYGDPSTRPSTAHSYGNSHSGGEAQGTYEVDGEDDRHTIPEPDPSDMQIVLHISYSGNVSLSLTAEILLDYPMTSFVGIPLKLNITGLSFDGVALIAYLKQRAHFCFLGQDDAEMLVGAENALDKEGDGSGGKGAKGSSEGLGGLLKEIRVESEIGQKEGGKQVLKNVGKVEKFVLEQVRRIFEEEMVWPSFWTFLV